MALSFLDLIFPKKCINCGKFGTYLCNFCQQEVVFAEPVCPRCQRRAIIGKTHPGCATRYGLDGLVVGLRYRGAVKRLISTMKYRFAFDIGGILVDLTMTNLWRFDTPENVLLVPIPLHVKRKNWRGFNQAEIICKLISQKYKLPMSGEIIKRSRETRAQVGLKRDARKANVVSAFEVKKPKNFSGTIVLVDDVFTTGATMQEICKVFKRNGFGSVWGMAVALG